MDNVVGIVVPVYYGRRYLRQTLESIFGQDFPRSFSVVVVEDGTPLSDCSEDICRDFPVSYVYRSENRGVMASRLEGANLLSDSEYLAFLDQDDQWQRNFLSRMTEYLEEDPALGLVVCNARLIEDGHGQTLYDKRIPSLLLDDLKVANQIISPSQALLRTVAWKAAGLAGEVRGGADDWLMWLAILAKGYRAQYAKELLLDYRIHASGAHNDRHKMIQSERHVVDQWFLKLGFTQADQRRFYGRVAFDGLVEGLRAHNWSLMLQSMGQGIRDPWALNAAVQFRRRHKAQGLV
ncbi:MAG: glycosyltransferase family 2 protein [Sulfobacillus sp.]